MHGVRLGIDFLGLLRDSIVLDCPCSLLCKAERAARCAFRFPISFIRSTGLSVVLTHRSSRTGTSHPLGSVPAFKKRSSFTATLQQIPGLLVWSRFVTVSSHANWYRLHISRSSPGGAGLQLPDGGISSIRNTVRLFNNPVTAGLTVLRANYFFSAVSHYPTPNPARIS